MTEMSNAELLELTARVVCLWMSFYGVTLAVLRDPDSNRWPRRLTAGQGLGAWLWAAAATTFVTLQWLV